MLIELLISTALAHEGHNHAPHGPYKVVKVEKTWLDCKAIGTQPPRRFAAPFERATLKHIEGKFNDMSILLGPDVKLKEGDVLAKPVLATEECDKPHTMTCNERGQPNAPAYKGTLKDVYCAGKFNFVLVNDKDKMIRARGRLLPAHNQSRRRI